MSSAEDSDDEPLSVLVSKKTNKDHLQEDDRDPDFICEPSRKKKKVKIKQSTRLSITIKLNKPKKLMPPKIIERPSDVWLYMKDLNPTGPYSCLLCAEWFINRSKMIIHYIINHKKDFCGICRYFVPDRESWWAHMKFHIPWPCSQCIENFQTEAELRQHLSNTHKLVHCRLCHFRVSDGDQYNTHLFQKHNVTNVNSKDEETLWELEFEAGSKFLCLLCMKSNNLSSAFFNHYMGFHHFTLKCFSSVISGRDPPFSIYGAEVSSQFIDDQLKNQSRVGYIDLENKPLGYSLESANVDSQSMMLDVPEIKQEVSSDTEEHKDQEHGETEKNKNDKNDIVKTYKGDEDFDVTLMELIILHKCYYDYAKHTLVDMNSNIVPENSNINYDTLKLDFANEVSCGLCYTKHHVAHNFTTHMGKMHSVKSVPVYSCRVCVTTFDTQQELDTHIEEELGDFEDLWICQFCDKEFDNRETTRRHLTDHIEEIEFDNCFSPHLGFKCKFCPMLFWNETDRESHQVRSHFNKHHDQYYKCQFCSEIFSDKIWFIHHYLEKHLTQDKLAPQYLLKCCLCCLVLGTVEEMRSHFSSTHPEARKLFCSLGSCLYKPLSHKKSFKLHVRAVHASVSITDRSISCTICGREFPSSRACSTHVAQAHAPGRYKCKLCREVMHTLDERKLHYLIRHPGRHPFECSECGKSFQYKSSLYMHKQEHAPNKHNFTCKHCGKAFMKRDSFREHVQIHEGPRHACSYCPMRFVQRSNMLRHERRHTGERPYACPHCPRTFADKGACTSHSRTHSKDTSYACIYCGQTFVQKSKLTYHTRKHTGENLETCPVCSKLFTSACSLREHMKIHQSKKGSIKCPLCEKRYQDERYMLRHLRTTHTHARYSCPICHKAINSTYTLKYHVISHSAVNTFRCKICPKSCAVKKTIIRHLRKRHGIRESEVNTKEFYDVLDPRQCQLGLDEEVMTSIFGPPKKETANDVLIGDFVTIPKINLPVKDKNNDDGDKSDEDEQTDEEDKSDEQVTGVENIEIKLEQESDNEELEPTDFVSVKIEPVDEVGEQMEN